jgi:Family of unknown function (DUF5701)
MLRAVTTTKTRATARAEFDRQVENLRAKGYPTAEVASLAERLSEVPADTTFAVVVGVPRHEAIARVQLDGNEGFTTMDADDLARFAPIEGLELPSGSAYLVVDVDTGAGTLNVTPDAALETIRAEGRSPLTIDEGIALVTHQPELLRKRNCFSMLGSRCGDRRVTALWISGGRPRLGWCWAGNPHTWLGSASCGLRIGL